MALSTIAPKNKKIWGFLLAAMIAAGYLKEPIIATADTSYAMVMENGTYEATIIPDDVSVTTTGRVIVASQKAQVFDPSGNLYCIAEPGIRVYEYAVLSNGLSIIQYGTDYYAYTNTSNWYIENDQTISNGSNYSNELIETAKSTAGLSKECSDEDVWQTVVDAWNCVPEAWRTTFSNAGGVIHVTDDPDFWGTHTYVGLTTYSTGTTICYVRADEYAKNFGNSQITHSTVHEFGHWVDKWYSRPSDTSEFYDYYLEEKDSFENTSGSRYSHISNTHEYFAQIVAQIYLDPETANSAPKSFAYVQKYLAY